MSMARSETIGGEGGGASRPQILALGGDRARRIRETFASADFTEERLTEVLQAKDVVAAHSQGIPSLLYRTRGGSPLETLLRLFVIGVPVPVSAARKAVWPMALEEWAQAGLVTADGDIVAANVRLCPVQGLVFSWDLPSRSEADRVMGVAPSSLSLAGLTFRRQAARTLDVGTGCGVQGLLAARHSGQVTAIDKNPRAIAFAEQNALLNGISNVECLAGDLFEPVRGRRFELILSNPPFVMSPGVRYIYRDGGAAGDGFCQRIAREVPELLAEGGYFQMLCQWAHISGENVRDRLSGWFEGSGCDVLVLRADTRDVASYVTFWSGQGTAGKGDGDFAFEEWSRYFEEAGIEAVSLGFITMRRRSGGATWVRIEDTPPLVGECGEAIRRVFEVSDFLEATRDDDVLLRQRLRASPDLQMHQELSLSEEGWSVTEARLHLTRGLARAGSVNVHLATLVERFHEARRVNDVVNELSAGLGQSPASIVAGCLSAIRGLLEEGMLLPAEEPR